MVSMCQEFFSGIFTIRIYGTIYRKAFIAFSTEYDIILLVRLEQVGMVCGCPFRKRKGGRYEHN